MTLLNATITDRFAIVSADTAMSPSAAPEVDDAPSTSDIEAALASNFCGDGTAPTVESVGHAAKVIALPHLGMVVAGIGNWQFFVRWAAGLFNTSFETDVVGLNPFIPDQLRQFAQWHGDAPIRIVHVGWHADENRPAGFVYSSGDNFEPVALTGGHTTAPPPDPDDVEYESLADRFELAAAGIDVEDFHLALAQNQYRAFTAGKLADGVLLGGDLITARIDADGVHIRKAWRFPELIVAAKSATATEKI